MHSSVSAMAAWRTIRPYFPAYDAGQARVVTARVSLVRGTVPVCLPVKSSAPPGRRSRMPPSPA
jgi:hypothetical protein